jgi:two-component system, OmpR family, response regulator
MIKSVLIVEDESEIRNICKSILEKTIGLHVHAADSVQAALQLIQTQQFDLAVLDVHLDDGVGFELLAPLLDRNPNCQTMIMSAYNQCSEEQKACDYGVNFFLGKPFQKDMFVKAVQTLIK